MRSVTDNVRASVRDLISREIVSNILVHRDFSSVFPAKVIIEKDWIRTENWCRARRQGNILETEFTPYPKNPILARFFVAVGLADTIGSGVRNLYKYTPIYTACGKPELIEGDVFRINIPVTGAAVEEVMVALDISRATVFREYAKIRKNAGSLMTRKQAVGQSHSLKCEMRL